MAYFAVKVQVTTEEDKKGTQQYLVKAVSCTEAESKIYKLFEGSPLEFEVKSISETKFIEVIE